jgi:hypothetical protein
MPRNYSKYTPDERRAIWNRIRRAAKKFGIEIAEKDKFEEREEKAFADTNKGKKLIVKAAGMVPDEFMKARITPGLVPRQVTVHRESSVFPMRVWVRPDGESKKKEDKNAPDVNELFSQEDYEQTPKGNILKNLSNGAKVRYSYGSGYRTGKIAKIDKGIVTFENGGEANIEDIVEVLPEDSPDVIHELISNATPENRAATSAMLMGTDFSKKLPPYEFTPKSMKFKGANTKEVDALDYRDVEPAKIGLVQEKGILERERPSWIPEISDDEFRNNRFRLPMLKLDTGDYLVAGSGYTILMNLDVLAITQDYYMKRAKALAEKRRLEYEARYKTKIHRKRLAMLPDTQVTTLNAYLSERVTGLQGRERFMPILEAVKDMKQKLEDIDVQMEENYSTFAKGRETAYGDKGTRKDLLDEYGVLVKRQNGDPISPREVEDIKKALDEVFAVYGNRSSMAYKFRLKISHSGKVLMHARNAMGVFIPAFHAIGITFKEGQTNAGFVLSHEWAHFMDHYLAQQNGRYWYASDDWNSLPGKIASTFRNNMAKPQKSKYTNRTCECFARAFEEYFAIRRGEEKQFDTTWNAGGTYAKPEVFKEKIQPLIDRFFEENNELLKAMM